MSVGAVKVSIESGEASPKDIFADGFTPLFETGDGYDAMSLIVYAIRGFGAVAGPHDGAIDAPLPYRRFIASSSLIERHTDYISLPRNGAPMPTGSPFCLHERAPPRRFIQRFEVDVFDASRCPRRLSI